jgi:MFS family permease
MGEIPSFYLFTAFIFSYGTERLGLSRDLLLMAVMIASAVSFITIPCAGWLSDKIGRKQTVLLGAALTIIMAFAYFAMIETRNPTLIILATVLSLIPHDLMWGPLGAFVCEAFPAKVRYSGAAIGSQIAAVFSGGPAPLIATFLVAQFHTGYSVAAYIAFCAVLSIVGAVMLGKVGEAMAAKPKP